MISHDRAAAHRTAVTARGLGLLRDALVVVAGWLTLHAPPPSVAALDSGLGVRLWSLMLMGGGLVAAVGLLARRPLVESAGCFAAAAGFVVWTIAALTQPDVGAVSVAVALVFAAGAVGQIQQAIVGASGMLDAHRRCRR